jgi:hypothetical protein
MAVAAVHVRDLEMLSELCVAAINAHGADFARVEEHVMRSIDALPADRQAALKAAVAAFLTQQKAIDAGIRCNAPRH